MWRGCRLRYMDEPTSPNGVAMAQIIEGPLFLGTIGVSSGCYHYNNSRVEVRFAAAPRSVHLEWGKRGRHRLLGRSLRDS